MTEQPKCTRCGSDVDQRAIDNKQRIAGRLYPGRPATPPKVCSACCWNAIVNMVDNDDAGAGA